MKKMLSLLAIGFIFGALNVAAQAVISFDKSEHNFGKFAESHPQTHEFTFTNKGDKPLVIHQAMASCGCTVPTFPQAPIAPGKTGKIKVVYNGKGKFPGSFKKSISVRSNASNSLVRLYVSGDMTADDDKKK